MGLIKGSFFVFFFLTEMLLLKIECWEAAKFGIVYHLPQDGNIISVLNETGVDCQSALNYKERLMEMASFSVKAAMS